MKKRLNKLFIKLEDDHSNIKLCDEKDCNNPGEYEAPKSPNSSERYIFCLQHIKDYNKRWNFFAGKTQTQIYDYQKNDFFEGRPTKPFSKGFSSKVNFEFEFDFNKEKIKFKKKDFSFKNLKKNCSSKVKKALKIFSLNNDFDEKKLKKRYKELVKKYHPDINKNLLEKDSKIKEINNAYNLLTKIVKQNYEIT